MFDIGFAELLVLAVISLLVLGPERLPGAVRVAGLWMGRLRRSFNDIRAELEREANTSVFDQERHNRSIMNELNATEQQSDPGSIAPTQQAPNQTIPAEPGENAPSASANPGAIGKPAGHSQP